MAKKRKPDYRENHRKLKKLGILEGKLKKAEKYTPKEKRQISTLYNRFSKEADWAATPHTDRHRNVPLTYTTRNLKTRAEIKAAKENGYEVFKNKIVIKHRVGEQVRIVRSRTHLSKGKIVPQIELRFKGNIRRIQVATKIEILEFLEEMGNERVDAVADAARVTVKIGENNPFSTRASQAITYDRLLNYLSNWEPRDSDKLTKKLRGKLRLDLMGQMQIVYTK